MPLATLIFVAKLIFCSLSSSMCRLWPWFSLFLCAADYADLAQPELRALYELVGTLNVWVPINKTHHAQDKCKLDGYNTRLNPSLFSASAVFIHFFNVFFQVFGFNNSALDTSKANNSVEYIWYLISEHKWKERSLKEQTHCHTRWQGTDICQAMSVERYSSSDICLDCLALDQKKKKATAALLSHELEPNACAQLCSAIFFTSLNISYACTFTPREPPQKIKSQLVYAVFDHRWTAAAVH